MRYLIYMHSPSGLQAELQVLEKMSYYYCDVLMVECAILPFLNVGTIYVSLLPIEGKFSLMEKYVTWHEAIGLIGICTQSLDFKLQ